MAQSRIYNIFAKLKEEITDFDENGFYITGEPTTAYRSPSASRRAEMGGYYYSQRDTLESIDLACASKYKKGLRDAEGQRKTFLNIVNFYRDVMKMKININVANYIFEPRFREATWPVWLMDRIFKVWAAGDNAEKCMYDDEIDSYAHDIATYGTVVVKRLTDYTERVPLRTLRNTPSAKTLNHAAKTGGYVLIENDFHYNEMADYPDWHIDGLNKTKSYVVYERYALVPKKLVENQAWKEVTQVEIDKDDDMVLVMAILMPNGKFEKSGKDRAGGRILYMEEIDDIPLEECHAEKVDGRWLGKGEVEKQLENQISRNLNANLRRRGLLWAVKRIYQSTDDEVQKNLVYEAKDGEVLHVRPNGQIQKVDTSSNHSGEFSVDDEATKENSREISFAFEVATGESMPSGTPFRLGLVLDRAVASHFSLVRDTFSNFLKRTFFEQLIPIFQKEYTKEHEMQFPIGASEVEALKESMLIWHTNQRVFDLVVKGKPVVPAAVRMEVEEEMNRNLYLFVKMPKGFYKNARAYMKLNINDDIGPDLQTLTTIWQALNAAGDKRAENVMRQILAKQGKSFDVIAGPAQRGAPAAPQGTPTPVAQAPAPSAAPAEATA